MNFQNPSLLLAGLALISVPLVIHLLNRRRVRIVDWAAMDFLMEAQQKNRRRVLLENLLLLLLRCLAVGLLAMVVGRPLLNSALAGRFADTAPLERLVLLDDSLSMQSAHGAATSFELARDRLIELCRQWSAEPAASLLTLRVTSRPDEPVLQSGRLSNERIEEIVDTLRRLEPTDLPAALAESLVAVERDLEGAAAAPRLVYVVTDLRDRDWSSQKGTRTPSAAASSAVSDSDAVVPTTEILARLARRTQGAIVVDVGAPDEGNLVMTEIEPEGILAVDVPSRLTVKVWNAGLAPARELEIKFTAGDSLPLIETIDSLAAGDTAIVAFTVTFPQTLLDEEARDVVVPVKAEVTSSQPGAHDRLTTDSTSFLAARVRRGISVLIVDGDPSADYGKSESFYLARALAPPGAIPSGIAPEVVTASEFESLALDAYQVICLCNVSAVDEARREALEAWVRAGGGLALFPGDEVSEGTYNACWHRGGGGLSPIKLTGIHGDETERAWVTFRVDAARGSFLTILAGDDNPLLQRVKTFRWWGAALPPPDKVQDVAVLARWTDSEGSPAAVERTFGQGRVVWLAGPADADWSNWSSDPSYLVVMQELARSLARSREPVTGLRVGQPVRVSIDLAEFRPEAIMKTPRDERLHLTASPLQEQAASADDATPPPGRSPPGLAPAEKLDASGKSARTIWQFTYAPTLRQGFYELQLDGGEDAQRRVVLAANVDPSEGNLRRADTDVLRRELGDPPVTFVDAGNIATTRRSGEQAEIWWYLAWGLAGILGVEQLLAWRFGRNR